MKKMIIMAMMVAMVATLSAQTHVKRAYEELKQSGCITGQRNSNSTDNNGKCTGLLEICQFTTTDRASQRKVNDLIEAFKTDSDEAYSYVYHKAGDARQRYSIYYDSENTELVGDDKSLNYVLLNMMDPEDATGKMRYCYVVEWKETDDGQLTGRAIKTYAPKPSKSRKPFVVNVNGKQWSSGDLDDIVPGDIKSMRVFKGSPDSVLIELKKAMPDSLGQLIDLDELGETLKTLGDSIENLKDLKDLKGLQEPGNLKSLGGLRGLGRILVYGGNDDATADDVEWLTSFNHYRNAFKRAAARESSSAASYATSILKLCKKVQNAGLTDGELNLCRKSIKELQKLTKDEFVKGLLDEAMRYLK